MFCMMVVMPVVTLPTYALDDLKQGETDRQNRTTDDARPKRGQSAVLSYLRLCSFQ